MLQSDIAFKYSWRPYQARVLKEIDAHLDDRHLHIVAAPGSGKTVLGLEVMLRLQKPTLILAPTLAIRNQWADRFVELFIDAKKRPDWISFDPKNPKRITISTYQGLHSALSGMHEEEELDITRLEEASLDSGETEVDYEDAHRTHIVENLPANAEIPENLKNLGLSDEQINAVLQLMKEPASEDSESATQEVEHQESQPKSKNAKKCRRAYQEI